MPLAKSAQEQHLEPKPQQLSKSEGIMEYNGVPVDVLRFFNTDFNLPNKDMDKLVDIYSWAKNGLEELTMGNVLQKISSLEVRLGAPHLNESRYDKLWNWVKLESQINDLRKQQEAYKRPTL